jgi:hypothetical protein
VAKDHVIPTQFEGIVIARMNYDRKMMEVPPEEEKPASVDTET